MRLFKNMKDKQCPYESAAIEAGERISSNDVCIHDLLIEQQKQKGFKAGKGLCKKCKKHVDVGTFSGPSVSSLTENKNSEV